MRSLSFSVLLVIALVAPLKSEAQTFGCYVDRSWIDYYGVPCSNTTLGCGDSSYLNWLSFGTSVQGMCDDIGSLKASLATCNQTQANCSTNYGNLEAEYSKVFAEANSYYTAYNKCVGDYNSLYNTATALVGQKDLAARRLNALVRKLRKACGSKCKKIK